MPLPVYCETPDNNGVGNDDYINRSNKINVSLNEFNAFHRSSTIECMYNQGMLSYFSMFKYVFVQVHTHMCINLGI